MTPVWKSVLLFAALTLFGTPLGVALHERSQDRLEIAALKEAIEREKAAHENAQKIAQSVVDSFVRQGHADNEIRKLETVISSPHKAPATSAAPNASISRCSHPKKGFAEERPTCVTK